MKETTNCWYKEVEKMGVFVALIAFATFFAAPFALGFVATACNSMCAGEFAAGVVIFVGFYLALRVIVRGIWRICHSK